MCVIKQALISASLTTNPRVPLDAHCSCPSVGAKLDGFNSQHFFFCLFPVDKLMFQCGVFERLQAETLN